MLPQILNAFLLFTQKIPVNCNSCNTVFTYTRFMQSLSTAPFEAQMLEVLLVYARLNMSLSTNLIGRLIFLTNVNRRFFAWELH